MPANLLYKTAQVESPQLTAKLKQLLTVLHHVTHAQTHNTNTVSSACPGAPHTLLPPRLHRIFPQKRGSFFPLCWKHNLCVAALNSVKDLDHARYCCSITAPLCSLPAPRLPAELTAARRRRGNPRSGLDSAMAVGASNSCLLRGSLQRDAAVSGTSSRRDLTATCTAVSGRDG